jgi:integrase
MIDAKAATPVAANHFLQALRRLMKLAIDLGWRKDDPTAGILNIRNRSEGFRTWSEEDISTYEAKFPLGSRARLAFALLLHTGQRRGDVVRMGRQHIRNGVLTIQQQKTGQEISLPIHANLKAAIASLPKDQLSLLLTGQGKPFTPAGFTNWFHQCVVEAGLAPGLSPHGLRKAVCRRLAEAGCSPHEIMAISGHRTLSEVTRYTMAANRVNLAVDAMKKIEARTATVKPVPGI